MSEKSLKMEFNYSVRNYVEPRNGLDCYEVSFQAAGELVEFLPAELPSLRSIGTSPIETSLSIAAMQFKEALQFRLGRGVILSDLAYFTNPEGVTIGIEPAVYTPH